MFLSILEGMYKNVTFFGYTGSAASFSVSIMSFIQEASIVLGFAGAILGCVGAAITVAIQYKRYKKL